MAEITEYLENSRERHVDELEEFLRIPSVSAKAEHGGDMKRAAEWLVERMLEAGLQTAEVMPTAGHPVVLGGGGGANAARLRPLRRAAAGAAGRVADSALRADGAEWQALRAGIRRR
jgi:acetylornithine deacetylase/succinyl-diaminopimelate desuccinylase-like protein